MDYIVYYRVIGKCLHHLKKKIFIIFYEDTWSLLKPLLHEKNQNFVWIFSWFFNVHVRHILSHISRDYKLKDG